MLTTEIHAIVCKFWRHQSHDNLQWRQYKAFPGTCHLLSNNAYFQVTDDVGTYITLRKIIPNMLFIGAGMIKSPLNNVALNLQVFIYSTAIIHVFAKNELLFARVQWKAWTGTNIFYSYWTGMIDILSC